MSKSYDGRDYSVTKPTRSRTKPGLSPLIAAVVLIVALVCLVSAEKKRRAPAKPASKPEQPAPSPQSDYDEEAALIDEAKGTFKTNKSRISPPRSTGVEPLWQ